jgi:hypothetical protein
MPLKFNGRWRFEPPNDTEYVLHRIPPGAVDEFVELVRRLAPQGDRWGTLELFKRHFVESTGATHWRSSALHFAEHDLLRDAQAAAGNAPLFIEAFFDACRAFEGNDEDRYAPDAERINAVLVTHNVGFEIRGDRLVLRGREPELIAVNAAAPTLAERSVQVVQESLQRASQMLDQGRGREAVQESLWLLETVTTAFRGLDTEGGSIEGRYFNQIVRELRTTNPGGALGLILQWALGLHGYLSSPTGGGVRHGLDLQAGVQITQNEARLFCNLIRSYVSFLLVEHERMVRGR